jgi:hypothetical protein
MKFLRVVMWPCGDVMLCTVSALRCGVNRNF